MTSLTTKFTELANANVGSLVRYDRNKVSYFAIVLDKSAHVSRVVIIGITQEKFAHTEIRSDTEVLDLGQDWLFEATNISDPFVDGNVAARQIGLLTFDATGEPVLSVNDYQQNNDVTYFKVKSTGPVPGRHFVSGATDKWALWANKDERESLRGKPLLLSPSPVEAA